MAQRLEEILAMPNPKDRFSVLLEHVETNAGSTPADWNSGQRTFFLCCPLINEVNNGGVAQWFANTSPLNAGKLVDPFAGSVRIERSRSSAPVLAECLGFSD
jgi:hypothetical protein